LERWKEAIASYEKAVQLKPNFAEAHYRLFRAYRRVGESSHAEQALQIYQKLQQQKETENVVMQFVYNLRE
jgi:tetratricopeptide (TPR) repeat protein